MLSIYYILSIWSLSLCIIIINVYQKFLILLLVIIYTEQLPPPHPFYYVCQQCSAPQPVQSYLNHAIKLFKKVGCCKYTDYAISMHFNQSHMVKINSKLLVQFCDVVALPVLIERPCLKKAKVLMQGKLFQRCTHFLYSSLLSLGGKVNTRRMSQLDMEPIFTKIIYEIFWS